MAVCAVESYMKYDSTNICQYDTEKVDEAGETVQERKYGRLRVAMEACSRL